MKKIRHRTALRAAVVVPAAALLLQPTPAHAVTYNKANNTTALNQTGSWATSIVPTSTDIAQWTNTVTGANTTGLGGNLSWMGIKIANPGGAVAISSGSTLTLGTSGIDLTTANNSFTLSPSVILAGAQSWNATTSRTITVGGTVDNGGFTVTLNGAGAKTVSGSVSGAGGFNVTAGTATLSGSAHTFTGGVTVSNATLNLNSASALGGAAGVFTIGPTASTIANTSAGAVTLSNNNAQNWNGNFTLAGAQNLNFGTGAVTMNAARTVTVSGTGAYTVGGAIDDGGSGFGLTVNNGATNLITGRLILNGGNTYSGGTTINGSAVRFGASGAPGTGTITVGANGALVVAGPLTTLSGWLGDSRLAAASSGALALPADSAEAFDPATAGKSNFSLGAELGATAVYTGMLTSAGGAYRVGGGGGTIRLDNVNALTGGNNLIAGNGGGGTVVVAQSNDYTGTTTINAGTLQIGNGGTTGSIDSSSSVVNNGNLTINRSDSTWFTVPVSGTGSFTKLGAGSLTLTVANSYAGGTNVNAGTLIIGADNTLPTATALNIGSGASAGNLDLSIASQTVSSLNFRSNTATANTVTIGNGRTLLVNGTGSYSQGIPSPFANGATTNVTFTGGGTLHVNNTSGIMSVGIRNVDQNSTGNTASLNLFSLNEFLANLSELRAGYDSRIGTTLTLSNTSNDITATTIHVGNSLANNGTASSVILGEGINRIHADQINLGGGKTSGTLKFASTAVGTGTVTIAGKTGAAANITIGNSNTDTAGGGSGTLDLRGHDVAVTAGTLSIAPHSQTSTGSSSGNFVYFNSGTFDVATVNMAPKTGSGSGATTAVIEIGGGTFTVNTAFTVGSRTGSAGTSNATVNLNGGTLISNTDIVDGGQTGVNSTLTIAGGTLDLNNNQIGGATAVAAIDTLNLRSGTLRDVAEINAGGAITKSTAGLLIFDGVNSYTGATAVNDGTLRIMASTALGSTTSTADITVADAGLLDLQTPAISDLAGLIVTSTDSIAEVQLNYAGTDLLTGLTLNGNSLGDGIYGSTSSGAPNISLLGFGLNPDDFFSGTGTLTVGIPEPGAAGVLAVAGLAALRRRRLQA